MAIVDSDDPRKVGILNELRNGMQVEGLGIASGTIGGQQPNAVASANERRLSREHRIDVTAGRAIVRW